MEEGSQQRRKRQRETNRTMEESRPTLSPSTSGISENYDEDDDYSTDSAKEAISRRRLVKGQTSIEQNDTASSDRDHNQDGESASSQGKEDYGDDGSVKETAEKSFIKQIHNATRMPTMDAPINKSANSSRKILQSSLQQPQNDAAPLLNQYGLAPTMRYLHHANHGYQPSVSMAPARSPTKYFHVTVKWDPCVKISCTLSDPDQTVQAFVATFLSGLGDASLELLWQRAGRKSKDGGVGVVLSVGPTHNLVLERTLSSQKYTIRQRRQWHRLRETGACLSGLTLRIGAHCIVPIAHVNESSNSTKGISTLLTPSDSMYDLMVATHPCDAETVELKCQGSRSWAETSIASFIGSAESKIQIHAETRYLPVVSRKRTRSHSPDVHAKRNASETERSKSPTLSTSKPPAKRCKEMKQFINDESPDVTSNENASSPATSTTKSSDENHSCTRQPIKTNTQRDIPINDFPIEMFPGRGIAEIEKVETIGRLDDVTAVLAGGNDQINMEKATHVSGSMQLSQHNDKVASSSTSQEDEGKESSSDITEIAVDEGPCDEAVDKSFETNEEAGTGQTTIDYPTQQSQTLEENVEDDEEQKEKDAVATENESDNDRVVLETADAIKVFVEGSLEFFSGKADGPLETDNASVSSSDSSSCSSTDSSSSSSSSASSSSSSSSNETSSSNSSSSSDSSDSSSSSSNSSGNVKSQMKNGNEVAVPTPKPFSSAKATTSMTAAATVSTSTGHRPKHRPLLDPKQKIVILPTSRRLSYT